MKAQRIAGLAAWLLFSIVVTGCKAPESPPASPAQVEISSERFGRLEAALQASYAWGQSHEEKLIEAMRETFLWEAPFLKSYLSKLSYDFDAKTFEEDVAAQKECMSVNNAHERASA